MANESWVTGKKYRILTDLANKKWSIMSFINKATDTIFNDNKSAETKLGVINGITDSLVSNASDVAASAKSVATLNSNLDECTFERREDGAYITYTPPGGADPVSKKLGSDITIVVQALANVDNTGESNTPAKSTLTITIRDGQVVESSMVLDNTDWSGRVRVHAMSVVSVVQD